jgi:hypothetical protein
LKITGRFVVDLMLITLEFNWIHNHNNMQIHNISNSLFLD